MLEEGKKEKDDGKIVMRVDMDCEGCKEKVRRALKSVPGLEKINIDLKEQKVTVKGNVDPRTVCETVRKRSGKRTVLLSPELKKEDEKKSGKEDEKKSGKEDEKRKEDKKKEEVMIGSISKIVDSISDLLNPKPPNSTVELKVRMHCGGCAKQISKSIKKMEGVMVVEVDAVNDKVIVKGRNLDANEVCDRVRCTGKYCEIVPQSKKADKKEEKKEENKSEKAAEKKKEEKPADEKKEEKPAQEKKGGKKGGKAAQEKSEVKPAEEKKEQKAEEKAEEKKEEKAEKEEKKEEETVVEIRRYDYAPYRNVPEYVYPPQLFSDENPNACSIM